MTISSTPFQPQFAGKGFFRRPIRNTLAAAALAATALSAPGAGKAQSIFPGDGNVVIELPTSPDDQGDRVELTKGPAVQSRGCDAPTRKLEAAPILYQPGMPGAFIGDVGVAALDSLMVEQGASLQNVMLKKFVLPAVVAIQTRTKVGDKPSSLGSGFICRNEKLPNGKYRVLVFTNDHVTPSDNQEIAVFTNDENTTKYNAKVVWRNPLPKGDLALLAFESDQPLPTLALAQVVIQGEDRVMDGENTCFLGHPAALMNSLLCGNVAALLKDVTRRITLKGLRQFNEVPQGKLVESAIPGFTHGVSGAPQVRTFTGEVLGLGQSIPPETNDGLTAAVRGLALAIHPDEMQAALDAYDQQQAIQIQ